MVVIIWLFVVLIITSSYTASLTSILTVQQLSPTIKGIDDLISSNVPIGYLSGSFVKKYLSEELNIAQSRLKPFESPESYANALMDGPSRGGVAAVIDELPAIKILLANHCGFKIAGQPFTKTSWGFVFQKGSPLVIDMSTAILNLSESGELQRIHDKWLGVSRCKSQSEQEGPNQLGLKNFWGLFLIIGVTSFSAFLAFLGYSVIQFRKRSNTSDDSQSRSVLIMFLHFVFLEGQKCKEEETKSKCERECTSSHHTSR